MAEGVAKLGYGWLAYQADRPHAHALRDECEQRGIRFGLWQTRPITGASAVARIRAVPRTRFYIAEAETRTDWIDVASSVRSAFPDLSCAIVTNFGGLNIAELTMADLSAQVAALLEADFACMTEAYMRKEDGTPLPTLTPENLEFRARQLSGWARETGLTDREWCSIAPVFGLYGGLTIRDYEPWFGLPGWSTWLAEYHMSQPGV